MKKQIIDRQLLNNKIGSNTCTALRCLIDNCYYAQISMPSPCYPKGDNAGYLKEFCTVRMCTARGSGHTTAICKVAKEYFENAIFLSPTVEMSERLNECFRSLQVDSSEFVKTNKHEIFGRNGRYLFGTYNSLDTFRGNECEAVFVDGTFMMNNKKEEDIYTILSPCMCKYSQRFFIFIQ